MNALHISGNDLTLEAVREVALERRPVLLAPDARERVNAARTVVDTLVADNQVSYAITTGVGKLSDVRIAGDQIRELQINLVRSHAVGVGEPLSIPETRAMMLLRANSLSKGFSGVRGVAIDTICELLTRGVTPWVPSQGSVGASGDLAPLAHLALLLVGEGECHDGKGGRIAGADALKAAGIKPIILEAKEAVSLINGTQAMQHFVGWEEPKLSSPYGSRDVRTAFASIRHKYKVWKAFRDHTGHWPVFSIWFHFLSWLAVIGFTVSAFVWVAERKRESRWTMFAVVGVLLVLLGARELGARLMRKMDWKKYGT